MKKLFFAGSLFFIMIILSACQKDLPEPETKDFAFQQNAAVQASGLIKAASDSFFVKHQVKGSDVYLECIVEGTSFRDDGARIILFIDGKRTKEINNAAFIVKGLNKGAHKIKLDLMEQNKNTAVATKEIQVVIQ